LASGAGLSKDFLAVATACSKLIYKYIHVQRVGEFTVDVQQHDRVQPLRRHRCPQVKLQFTRLMTENERSAVKSDIISGVLLNYNLQSNQYNITFITYV